MPYTEKVSVSAKQGTGVFGTWTALNLRRMGARVTLVDLKAGNLSLSLDTFDRRANLANIRVPTLLIAGEHDPNAPPSVMNGSRAVAIVW